MAEPGPRCHRRGGHNNFDRCQHFRGPERGGAPPVDLTEPGHRLVINADYKLEIGINGVGEGAWISGTKSDCTAAITARRFWSPQFPNAMQRAFVNDVSVTVGGEAIHPLSQPDPSRFDISFRFASTHFEDNDEVPIVVSATFVFELYEGTTVVNRITTSAQAVLTPRAYNKGAAFGLSELEELWPPGFTQGVPSAVAAFQAMNHTVIAQATSNWTKQGMSNAIAECTAFYVNSHGNSDPRFQTEEDDANGEPVRAYPSDVQNARQIAAQNGLPPVNLAFVDACNTAITATGGENHAFSIAFLYPINGYIGVDRAQVGWRVLQDAQYTTWVCDAFWQALIQYWTVHEARDDAVYRNPNFASEIDKGTAEARDFMAVYGDYYTRLNGVYTGNDAIPGTIWFIVL